MRARRSPTALIFFAIAVLAASRPVRTEQTGGQAGEPSSVDALLARVEQRVLEYFARARSIVCEETTRIEQLDVNFASGFGLNRRVVAELRVAWDAAVDGDAPEATVHREILTINGRPPKARDINDCFDPKPISPAPLAMLVEPKRAGYQFSISGTKKVNDRRAIVLEYKPTDPPGTPKIEWTDNCVSVDLPNWSEGRVFVDAASGDVLRLDESMTRRFEFDVPVKQQLAFGPVTMTIDRVNTSVHYKPVTFHDPEETVLLPDSIETFQSFRTRTRIVQTYRNYRRFMTGGRLVKDPR
jgi:hypothetical protein